MLNISEFSKFGGMYLTFQMKQCQIHHLNKVKIKVYNLGLQLQLGHRIQQQIAKMYSMTSWTIVRKPSTDANASRAIIARR